MSEDKCGKCGGTKDNPRTMSDDSYSTFKCPYPFHWKPKPKAKPEYFPDGVYICGLCANVVEADQATRVLPGTNGKAYQRDAVFCACAPGGYEMRYDPLE